MTDEEKAKQIGNLQLWKAENPEKMQVAEARRLEKKKVARKDRELVGVDLEGFDTGRYFTDDRPDYARELHEGIARGYAQDPVKQQEKLDKLLKDHIVISEEERLAQQVFFAGWTSVFGSERLTGALLDRLTHHVHILEMNGDSYRLNQSKRRSRRASADTPAG
jgi:IstB-like ATP binding protein